MTAHFPTNLGIYRLYNLSLNVNLMICACSYIYKEFWMVAKVIKKSWFTCRNLNTANCSLMQQVRITFPNITP